MARVLADLEVRLDGNGTSWSLLEPLEYHVGTPGSDEVIEAPAGFRTDFASVPWFGRWLVSTWKRTARAAVIHDYLYSMEGRRRYGYERARADAIFLEVLRVMGHKRRLIVWLAVRIGGGAAWRGHERAG